MKAMIVLACIAMLAGSAGGVKISPALQMDTFTDAENADQSFGEDSVIWAASQVEFRQRSHIYPLQA